MGLSKNPSEPRTGGRISCELTFTAQAADPRAAKALELDPAATGADSGCELTVQTLAAETPPPARGTNAQAAPDRPRPHLRPTPRGLACAPSSTAQRWGPEAEAAWGSSPNSDGC